MILKLDVEQALALFCFDFWLLLTARSLRLRKVAATEITGWRRVEHQSRGKAGDRVSKCGFFRTLAKFRAEWRNNGKIPWNHKIGWDPHRRIIGIIGQTGEIFGTSVSQVADLQLLVRCSRHKTPAAWLHTVAHRWDDTEMTQRWDNIRTASEQHGNTGFARRLPPNLQFPRCFHIFSSCGSICIQLILTLILHTIHWYYMYIYVLCIYMTSICFYNIIQSYTVCIVCIVLWCFSAPIMAELRSECRGRHVSPAFGSLREGAVDRHELNLVPPRAKQQKQQSNKDHLEIFKRLVSGRTSTLFWKFRWWMLERHRRPENLRDTSGDQRYFVFLSNWMNPEYPSAPAKMKFMDLMP